MLSSCRRVVVSSCLATALLVFCGCRSDSPRPQFISIATGGTGGVYYPYGGGLAKVLNDSLPNIRATAEVTAASVDNLKFIRDGKADVAFALADTVADAAAGRGAFEGRSVPVAGSGSSLFQLHACGDAPIERHHDHRRLARPPRVHRVPW